MSNLTPELMNELSQPFDPALVQWKPQATNRDKTKALAVAYVDTRAYIDRLNTVCGADWSDDYQVMDGGSLVLCRLTTGGVTRCDVGEKDPNDQNTATSAIAQAFKRAATKFGLGRYLYALPKTWAGYDAQRKRFTASAVDRLERIAGTPAGGNGKANGRAKPHNDGAFVSPEAAIRWGMAQGAFRAHAHAKNAYQKLKRERQPQTAAEMAQLWRDDVAQRLVAKERVAVTWQPLPPDRLGDCSPDGRHINVGTEDAAVFFHELAHAAHARLNGGRLEGGQHAGQETVAEFTAAVLMALYGLGDRTGNAWRYVAGYASDPLLAIVKALSTVEKVLALLGV